MGRWVLSDRFSPQPEGPVKLSTAHEILIHGYEEAGTEELPDFRILLPKEENGEIAW